MTANEIGCFLSHKKAWQACVKENRPTLIFEDDFIILPHFERTVELLLTEFQDWQIVRLQALAQTGHDIVRTFGDLSIVRNHEDPLGATAYIVKPDAARILVEHARDIYEPLDHFLEHTSKHGLEVLAVKPYPVDISRAPSTIADRPNDRKPIRGLRKKVRSISRALDRLFAKDPWFPR